ncbi:MAG: hypothetical protein ACXVA4_09955 [Ktedonobacterales bacterium]
MSQVEVVYADMGVRASRMSQRLAVETAPEGFAALSRKVPRRGLGAGKGAF